jgi:hypothetical protein
MYSVVRQEGLSLIKGVRIYPSLSTHRHVTSLSDVRVCTRCGQANRKLFVEIIFICRPSDSTVSMDAGIEPRSVATGALAVRRSYHWATSHPHFLFGCRRASSAAFPWGYSSTNFGEASCGLFIHLGCSRGFEPGATFQQPSALSTGPAPPPAL